MIWTLRNGIAKEFDCTRGFAFPLGQKIGVALERETDQSFMIDRNLTRGFWRIWRWISSSSLEFFWLQTIIKFWKVVSSLRLDLNLNVYLDLIWTWICTKIWTPTWQKENLVILKSNQLREHPTSNFVRLSLQKFNCMANKETTIQS